MSDFDEKLNSLLSNPDAMSQIMQLAQSLGGTAEASKPPPAQPVTPPPVSPIPDLSSLLGGGALGGPGGLDLSMAAKLLPLLQAFNNQDSNARPLLLALRPYLRPERQDKVDQALQLARLFCIGKKLLAEREE